MEWRHDKGEPGSLRDKTRDNQPAAPTTTAKIGQSPYFLFGPVTAIRRSDAVPAGIAGEALFDVLCAVMRAET